MSDTFLNTHGLKQYAELSTQKYKNMFAPIETATRSPVFTHESDQSKWNKTLIYVFVGNDEGTPLITGHMYQYDDDHWEDFGKYGSVQVDNDLTLEGAAADAKAVGDRFNVDEEKIEENSNRIDALYERHSIDNVSIHKFTDIVDETSISVVTELPYKSDTYTSVSLVRFNKNLLTTSEITASTQGVAELIPFVKPLPVQNYSLSTLVSREGTSYIAPIGYWDLTNTSHTFSISSDATSWSKQIAEQGISKIAFGVKSGGVDPDPGSSITLSNIQLELGTSETSFSSDLVTDNDIFTQTVVGIYGGKIDWNTGIITPYIYDDQGNKIGQDDVIQGIPYNIKLLSDKNGLYTNYGTSTFVYYIVPERIIIDSTLTQEGEAADAKAVGDRLQAIEDAISALQNASR